MENLDERVCDHVLYDILIQGGHVVDLYIPHDKETDKPKGFAFSKYEMEENADYVVKLFSGLVTLYNRTLKFTGRNGMIGYNQRSKLKLVCSANMKLQLDEKENLHIHILTRKPGRNRQDLPICSWMQPIPYSKESFKETMKMGCEVYHHLKENKKGLELLKTAIDKAGYTGKVVIGMDVAASEFYVKDKTYDLNFKERYILVDGPKFESQQKSYCLVGRDVYGYGGVMIVPKDSHLFPNKDLQIKFPNIAQTFNAT
ncbi:putative mannan endo-1,4-beta-mannosidase 5 [Capsicum annuum]|nr:putative mannan endo-1,4-beta-mannosidase 5 [Capsicum annuum]